jgi:hypothetical protein
MLMMVEQLDKAHYSPRCYVVAATDRMSGTKALTKEQAWASSSSSNSTSSGSSKASGGLSSFACCRRYNQPTAASTRGAFCGL